MLTKQEYSSKTASTYILEILEVKSDDEGPFEINLKRMAEWYYSRYISIKK